jgi:hypothetical protein
MTKTLIPISLFMLFSFYTTVTLNAQMRQGPGMMQQQNQTNQSITEDRAKSIIQNYINQNPTYKFTVEGYAVFTTPRGANSYVFELQSGNTNYMIYINPNGFILGPSTVKQF